MTYWWYHQRMHSNREKNLRIKEIKEVIDKVPYTAWNYMEKSCDYVNSFVHNQTVPMD